MREDCEKKNRTFYTNKDSNICIIGISKGKERRKGAERIFEDIMAENVPNSMKYMNLHIQEAE